MTKYLLENSVQVLRGLHTELHGEVEDSVLRQLDEVIQALQALEGEELELSMLKWKILLLFGEAIVLIPSVAKALGGLVRIVENAASH